MSVNVCDNCNNFHFALLLIFRMRESFCSIYLAFNYLFIRDTHQKKRFGIIYNYSGPASTYVSVLLKM